ncbi:hypothetical protein TNCV_707771 [Trichonephila clavipes]|nr:hypothetical protein TNCV_707771 [Trichonephila clavipes]
MRLQRIYVLLSVISCIWHTPVAGSDVRVRFYGHPPRSPGLKILDFFHMGPSQAIVSRPGVLNFSSAGPHIYGKYVMRAAYVWQIFHEGLNVNVNGKNITRPSGASYERATEKSPVGHMWPAGRKLSIADLDKVTTETDLFARLHAAYTSVDATPLQRVHSFIPGLSRYAR